MTIYLDYQATTPMDPRVLESMLPWFGTHFGNAASVQHAVGRSARGAVEFARDQLASVLGCRSSEVIFTSGATESNNLALWGLTHLGGSSLRRQIISARTEHKAILDVLQRLASEGFEISFLSVDRMGRIDLDELEHLLSPNTLVVSLMAANNEIGTLAPLPEVAERAHQHGALFHTDAAQLFGKAALRVEEIGIDVLSLSGHKIYGPKGMGALYVRRGIDMQPMILGGGHEGGLRSGTLNTPGCVGLGSAAAIALAEMEIDDVHSRRLAGRFTDALKRTVPTAQLIGPTSGRLGGNLNFWLPGVEADDLMVLSEGVAISSGSACSAASPAPSHVLAAVGLSYSDAQECIRVGFGRFSTEDDVTQGAAIIGEAVSRLRDNRVKSRHGGLER